ncbi:carbohydrate ABC transporter membrane protein 2, CUT1 family [Psychromonas ingrahamii 37]|uniref:Carbohydrate ABC transporter membrane protein 2, CUT1 family n=1 Tax=Psychromonas ingrahamii (strain DSM 17664 / CCUG 51855 / 37) TaxID=357804 RepID=A1SXL6_PSYIN|nr:carbohydrate ABC transporter permease [Psychromonas ingrahamii]ABM04231.1 carbohydrate ABC transporter membrane protein 2, CUT1 family [Psychromonas ingrahamii 37]
MNTRNIQTFILGAMVVFAALWLVPMLWMFSLSFQPNALLARDTADTLLGLFPAQFTLDNYIHLFSMSKVPQWFWNSVIVSGMTTILVLLISSIAGFAFARLNFPGKKVMYPLVLAGLMIPEQAVFIPLYTFFSDLGWHNSYAGLIIPRLSLPIGVFMMTQYFKEVPNELEEAAKLDGASIPKQFLYIFLPLARPVLTTLGIITFLFSWNDYLWPLVSAQQPEMFTITVGLASIQGNFAQSEGLGSVMASGAFASLPVIILYIIFQKHIVKGFALGGEK